MKKIIRNFSLTFVLSLTACSAFAQGSVIFDTTGNANSALGRVFFCDCPAGTLRDPGPDFVGQLAWSDTAIGTFVPFDTNGDPKPFSTATPGYIQGGMVGQSTRLPGAFKYVQMRVWKASVAATWEAALSTDGSCAGSTQTKGLFLGGVDPDDYFVPPQQFNSSKTLLYSRTSASAPPRDPRCITAAPGRTWS